MGAPGSRQRWLTWHNGGSSAYSALIVLDRANNRAAGYLAASGDLDSHAEKLLFSFLDSRRDETGVAPRPQM